MALRVRGDRPRRGDRQAAGRAVPGGRTKRGGEGQAWRRPPTASSWALLEEGRGDRRIATLLLGLYRDDGELDYVGTAAVAPARHDEIADEVLPLLEDAPERRFSEPNRWGGGELEEAPVRPELVVEVRYDKVQGNRFRHGTKLIRLRPDKEPAQCTWRELRPPLAPDDPMPSTLGFVPEGT